MVAVGHPPSDPTSSSTVMPLTLGFKNLTDVIAQQLDPTPMSGQENDAIHYLQGEDATSPEPLLLAQ